MTAAATTVHLGFPTTDAEFRDLRRLFAQVGEEPLRERTTSRLSARTSCRRSTWSAQRPVAVATTSSPAAGSNDPFRSMSTSRVRRRAVSSPLRRIAPRNGTTVTATG
jgi:hypothetical protein